MTASVLYGNKLSLNVTKEFKQLVNISIAAGKFILVHPQYELIKEAMRLERKHSLEITYGPLLDELGLTPQESEAFLNALQTAPKKPLDEQLKNLLGDTRYSKYQDYKRFQAKTKITLGGEVEEPKKEEPKK